jgi:hypothetical protein
MNMFKHGWHQYYYFTQRADIFTYSSFKACLYQTVDLPTPSSLSLP